MKKCSWRSLALVFTCLVLQAEGSVRSEASPLHVTLAGPSKIERNFPAWIQLGADGAVLARALVPPGTCPYLTVDGASVAMLPRSKPSQDFSVQVCEALVPSGAKAAHYGSQVLHLPKVNPNKIVIIGDTGCKIKQASGVHPQACNDRQAWPFADVAAAAAKEEPDLIIHVGDYHYREAPCSAKDFAACGGAAAGDTWQSWGQDFFTPATPLLAAAPVILTRGNHELCSRGGQGWFRLLDPRPFQAGCADRTPPYLVRIGDHTVAVIDAADDKNIQPSLNQLPPGDAALWLVQHRPFLTPGIDDEGTGPTPSLPKAYAAPGAVAAVITGHVHKLSFNTFFDGRPPELIMGNGGTMLESDPKADSRKVSIHAETGYNAVQYGDFGYTTFERVSRETWTVTVHDRAGQPVIQCSMREGKNLQTKLECPRDHQIH